MAQHIEDRLAKLESETLYGPWAWESLGDDNTCGIGVAVDDEDRPIAGHIEDRESFVVEPVSAEIQGQQHADFICAMRNAAPALIAVVRAARRLEEKLHMCIEETDFTALQCDDLFLSLAAMRDARLALDAVEV